LKRQNDLYIFCLNTGKTREESYPLELSHWEFYVITTESIDQECGDAKNIGLKRIRSLSRKVSYSELKTTVRRYVFCLRNKKKGAKNPFSFCFDK